LRCVSPVSPLMADFRLRQNSTSTPSPFNFTSSECFFFGVPFTIRPLPSTRSYNEDSIFFNPTTVTGEEDSCSVSLTRSSISLRPFLCPWFGSSLILLPGLRLSLSDYRLLCWWEPSHHPNSCLGDASFPSLSDMPLRSQRVRFLFVISLGFFFSSRRTQDFASMLNVFSPFASSD